MKQLLKINIGHDAFAQQLIPDFFDEIGRQKYGLSPKESMLRYQRRNTLYERGFKNFMFGFAITLGLIIVFLVGNQKDAALWVTVIGGVYAAGSFVFTLIVDPGHEESAPHALFFDDLGYLFAQFEIEPGPDIGKMSEKEFKERIIILELGLQRARTTDMGALLKFEDMVNSARAWKLLDTSPALSAT